MNGFRKYLLVALALKALCACSSSFDKDSSSAKGDVPVEHGMMVLGKHLQDPYSVSNMTKALESLYPTKAGSVDVDETHLYVRFLPASEDQYECLLEMGVQMLDHPLDYEIVREGDYYHDPNIPEGEITWQYAVVPPDFPFPEDINYEILDHCHITEHEVFTRSGGDASLSCRSGRS